MTEEKRSDASITSHSKRRTRGIITSRRALVELLDRKEHLLGYRRMHMNGSLSLDALALGPHRFLS